MDIDFTFLGSGTSTGVPMLACDCETCRSDDPRDKRLRASALLRWQDATVVIDTTPDFRTQMLRATATSLDAVLLTHNHADHISGLDDLRQYRFGRQDRIPVFGSSETLESIRKRFDYIWNPLQRGGGVPKIDLHPVDAPFEFAGVTISPVPVMHGILPIYGYRLGDLAYISDVSEIPDTSMPLLEGLSTLVIDALRYRPHTTHFHLEAAIEAATEIGARQTYFTHLNHDCLHRRLEKELPPGMAPAFDGLTLRVRTSQPVPAAPE